MDEKQVARVIIVFDGDNYSDIALNQTGPLDVPVLRDLLLDGRVEHDTTMFLSTPAEGRMTPQQHGFTMILRQAGIRIITIKRTTKNNPETGEKVQVGYPDGIIYTHILRQIPHFDILILVSRDGDFAPLLEYLSLDVGKRVEVCGITYGMSPNLLNLSQRFWNLSRSDILEKIKLRREILVSEEAEEPNGTPVT